MDDQQGENPAVVHEEAIFVDAQGTQLPNAEGAVRGEILEHLADGTIRSTLVTFDDDKDSRSPA